MKAHVPYASALAIAGMVLTPAAPATTSWAAGPHSTTVVTAERSRTTWLGAGERLAPGEAVRSARGQYVLQQQKDGNLVLYKGKTPLWSTQTSAAGAFTAMQEDGNLVVYKGKTPLWASNTDGAGSRLAVQDDGNLVIYSGRTPVWSRHSTVSELSPGFSLKPNQYVRSRNGDYQLVQQEDGNLVLYRAGKPLWSAETGGNPGAVTQMQKDGNLVVHRAGKPLWSSATGGHRGASLVVQDDGNVVISKDGRPLWSTETTEPGTED